jgi:hypothetical protein
MHSAWRKLCRHALNSCEYTGASRSRLRGKDRHDQHLWATVALRSQISPKVAPRLESKRGSACRVASLPARLGISHSARGRLRLLEPKRTRRFPREFRSRVVLGTRPRQNLVPAPGHCACSAQLAWGLYIQFTQLYDGGHATRRGAPYRSTDRRVRRAAPRAGNPKGAAT